MRFVGRITEHGGDAVSRGVAPESAEGTEVLRHLEAFTDARAERYWQLVGTINGWPPFPARVPAFEWVIRGLRGRRGGSGAPPSRLPPRA